MANIFATLYGEAQNAMKATTYYGSTAVGEASEAEVMESYMQYAEAAIGMERDGYLYAEATGELMDKKGLSFMGAFFYAEADGGFFKKIVNGLIKLYEKAKEFIIKLLGRFRSNKQYRQDLIYIEDVLKTAATRNYTEGASINAKKIKYKAIGAFIVGTLGDGTLLGHKFVDGDNATSITAILTAMKEAVKNSKDKNISKEKFESALTGLKNLRSAGFSNVDAYTRSLYASVLKGQETGGVDLTKTSNIKPAEAVAKLWEGDDKKYTGSEIGTLVTELQEATKELKFDKISKALDEGIGQYKDKLDELKSLLNEAENTAKSMQGMSSENTEKNDNFASAMVGASSQFSEVVANISTSVITAYNTGKVQLDKFIAVVKPLCAKLDELKKSSNAGTPAQPPKQLENGNNN